VVVTSDMAVQCVLVSKESFRHHMGVLRSEMTSQLLSIEAAAAAGTGTTRGSVMRSQASSGVSGRPLKRHLIVHRTLGVGQFGRVRLAQHAVSGAPYALKMLGRRAVVVGPTALFK